MKSAFVSLWIKALGAALLLALFLLGSGMGKAPEAEAPALPAETPVPAGPLSGKTILVDPGHGGTDGGAIGGQTGAAEKELTLQVGLLLKKALERQGAQVIMTRETDMQYSENKREDLTARLRLAADGGAQLLLSIHMNEYRSPRESGPQVFYRQGSRESRLLAGALQESLIEGTAPRRRRAAMAGDFFMLSLPIPSVLVECGFLSNPEEEKLLLTPSYQEVIAESIVQGVLEYFRLASSPSPSPQTPLPG